MVSAAITLRVLSGPLAGNAYEFGSHDTFLFGRDNECRAAVPEDRLVSRYHFALEINPPDVRLRDLGSLNGTFVNGVRVCVRETPVTQEDGSRPRTSCTVLKHKDVLAAGDTQVQVEVVRETHCALRGTMLRVEGESTTAALCQTCQRRTQSTATRGSPSPTPRCAKCRAEMTLEEAHPETGDCSCQRCRRRLRRSCRDLRAYVQEQTSRVDATEKSRQLASHTLEKKVLGKGGTGVVYRARSEAEPSRTIALKVILTDPAADEKTVKRVLREIGIGLDLKHKRIVRVVAHGSIGNSFYVAMELCEGGSLDRLLKRQGGRLPLDKAVRMLAMCLEGLEYLHQRNLVHRDLKPANILLKKDDHGKLHPKISDFGLAKHLALAGLSGMTTTGSFGGSWHYMPREQMTNFKFVGPVSDVWSLRATFYES